MSELIRETQIYHRLSPGTDLGGVPPAGSRPFPGSGTHLPQIGKTVSMHYVAVV